MQKVTLLNLLIMLQVKKFQCEIFIINYFYIAEILPIHEYTTNGELPSSWISLIWDYKYNWKSLSKQFIRLTAFYGISLFTGSFKPE